MFFQVSVAVLEILPADVELTFVLFECAVPVLELLGTVLYLLSIALDFLSRRLQFEQISLDGEGLLASKRG